MCEATTEVVVGEEKMAELKNDDSATDIVVFDSVDVICELENGHSEVPDNRGGTVMRHQFNGRIHIGHKTLKRTGQVVPVFLQPFAISWVE